MFKVYVNHDLNIFEYIFLLNVIKKIGTNVSQIKNINDFEKNKKKFLYPNIHLCHIMKNKGNI